MLHVLEEVGIVAEGIAGEKRANLHEKGGT